MDTPHVGVVLSNFTQVTYPVGLARDGKYLLVLPQVLLVVRFLMSEITLYWARGGTVCHSLRCHTGTYCGGPPPRVHTQWGAMSCEQDPPVAPRCCCRVDLAQGTGSTPVEARGGPEKEPKGPNGGDQAAYSTGVPRS